MIETTTVSGGAGYDLARPFARSYWVVPRRLLAGGYPGAQDGLLAQRKVEALVRYEIGLVINLMEPDETNAAGECFEPYREAYLAQAQVEGLAAEWINHPIRDMDVPSVEQMSKVLDAVDGGLATGRRVYVHCWGGKGRTGTVVGCWLVRHGERQGLRRLRELTDAVRAEFGEVPQTLEQRAMVDRWEVGQ